MTDQTWRSRIIEHADVDPRTLVPHPSNWRLHPSFQADAMKGALREVGWVQSVIVNKRTGKILDGHLRAHLAIEEDEATVPVGYVDVSEQEEQLILATFDPLGSMASAAGDALAALTAELEAREPALQSLLDELALEGEELTIGRAEAVGGARGRSMGDPARVVKALVYSTAVALFEEAMAATGLMNRGDALEAVCRAYLGKTEAR